MDKMELTALDHIYSDTQRWVAEGYRIIMQH